MQHNRHGKRYVAIVFAKWLNGAPPGGHKVETPSIYLMCSYNGSLQKVYSALKVFQDGDSCFALHTLHHNYEL